MSTKTVYQLNEQGLYLNETIAQESPLEPGVFLMPALCVEKAPTKYKDGSMAVYDFTTGKYKKVSNTNLVITDAGPQLISNDVMERAWRDSELARADIELNKSEDGDGVATPAEWRAYRIALRAYPDTEGFPDNTQLRPIAPTGV